MALGPGHQVPQGVATNSSRDVCVCPPPGDTWGCRGCSGIWAAVRQGCLWSPRPTSRRPQEREDPRGWQVGVMSHPTQAMGQAGQGEKGVLDGVEHVWVI